MMNRIGCFQKDSFLSHLLILLVLSLRPRVREELPNLLEKLNKLKNDFPTLQQLL
jgi:hypothetical protein